MVNAKKMSGGTLTSAFELQVGKDDLGQRIDVVLVRRVAGLSRKRAQELFAQGLVRVNGRRAKKGDRLQEGDWVAIASLPGPSDFHAKPAREQKLVVVLERKGFVIIDKPRGIPSHPLREHETETVAGALVARYPEMRGVGYRNREPGILHRLDSATSGLMIAARDQGHFERLREELRAGRIEKRYIAACCGVVQAPQRIELALANDPRDSRKVRVCVDPREIERLRARATQTEVLRSEPTALGSDVELRANHAFRHQVRAHLAWIGHPLIGDSLYGGPRREGHEGHLLHASFLSFIDPSTQNRVQASGSPCGW